MQRTRVAAEAHSRLERVYRQHGARLWRAVLMFAGDPDVASDAVAEAFAQALRRGAALRDPERWVWKVAFRIAAGELKERGRAAPMTTEAAYSIPEETIEVAHALESLSPKQRMSVVLHYFGDLPVRDVARVLGSTSAAVGVHLHRGRAKLRTLLEAHDG